MPEKTFKQICSCENCGNEAEMLVTCTLDDGQEVALPVEEEKPVDETSSKKKVQGQSVCSNCGNEADMWVEVE